MVSLRWVPGFGIIGLRTVPVPGVTPPDEVIDGFPEFSDDINKIKDPKYRQRTEAGQHRGADGEEPAREFIDPPPHRLLHNRHRRRRKPAATGRSRSWAAKHSRYPILLVTWYPPKYLPSASP
jgi:hypothetical protein